MRTIATALGVILTGCLSASPASSGDWTQHNVTDHLRGVVGVGIQATGEMEDNRSQRKAELVINCANNSTTLYAGAKYFYFGHDPVRVEYSLNGGPVQNATWSTCASSDCVGLWHGQGIPFAKSLFEKVMLRFTVHRSFSGPVYGTFAIAGAKEALEPVGQLCGWLPKPSATPKKN